jgi:hypothetical protein
MDLYILDSRWQRSELIDDLISAVWTERFYEPGDFEFVCPLTVTNKARLVIDTKISRSDSQEIMVVDTIKIKDGQMVISGKSLLNILTKRSLFNPAVFSPLPMEPPEENPTPTEGPAGGFIDALLYEALFGVSSPPPRNPNYPFKVKNIDTPDPATESFIGDPEFPFTYTSGSKYWDLVGPLAKTAGIGLSIYLDSAGNGAEGDPYDYVIRYRVYKGLDRRRSQSTNTPIVFSEKNGDLVNVEEFISVANAVTWAFVYAPGLNLDAVNYWYVQTTADAYANPESGVMNNPDYNLGFSEASIVIAMPELTSDNFVDNTTLQLQLARRGQEELQNNRPVHLVDGEIPATTQYAFTTDYNLGDLVEIETVAGASQDVRITEYIWISDNTGDRNYPSFELV